MEARQQGERSGMLSLGSSARIRGEYFVKVEQEGGGG